MTNIIIMSICAYFYLFIGIVDYSYKKSIFDLWNFAPTRTVALP